MVSTCPSCQFDRQNVDSACKWMNELKENVMALQLLDKHTLDEYCKLVNEYGNLTLTAALFLTTILRTCMLIGRHAWWWSSMSERGLSTHLRLLTLYYYMVSLRLGW